MNDPDLDDVAFLSGGGDSRDGRHIRNGNVAVCSQKRALCVTAMVLGSLVTTALIIAYAGPQNDCSCAGKMPPGYIPDYDNDSEPFNPIATNGEPYPWLERKLPNTVRPLRYTLTIHPNLTTLDVKGQVSIEFHVERETNFIVIHSQDLNVTEKAIVGPKGYAFKIARVLEFPPRQQIYIELKDRLAKKKNYTLNLRWYSKLVPEPEGFYVDEYESAHGIKRYLAATVFRPNGARRAFPCFDEPHLKAPFRISVFRDRFHIGLSNSIVHATDDVGFYMGTGLLRDDFIETPPLPPDAISWVVSDFQRDSLDPSPKYQPSTIPPPMFSMYTTTRPPDFGHFGYRKDSRPMKNILTGILLNPFNKSDNHNNGNGNGKGKHENMVNGKNNLASANGTTEFIDFLTKLDRAPSYTFYASQDILSKCGYILHTSRDVLEYLQTWLGVGYPLTKLDFVALPSLDREMISSLGIITLQAAFLQDADLVTTEQHHTTAIKISEAILKQFFGGITGPRIWKYAWLWDGIIKYLGRYILGPLQPQWPVDEMHMMHITTRAMDIDAIHGWRSILAGTNDYGRNDEFYIDKSASLLAMLHSAMGDELFRGCLGQFILTYRFQTAEPTDLWNICTRKTNSTKNIRDMMNLWTTLPGFPLLTVTKFGTTVTISQEPFEPKEFRAILDEEYVINFPGMEMSTTPEPPSTTPPPKKKSGIKWNFPIKFITNDPNISDVIWFTSSEAKFEISNDVKWIKLNAGQNGYYRVLYDEDNWSNIIQQLNKDHTVFSVKDRIGLISDAFTLCHANLMPCQITMNLLLYLPKERNWGPITTSLRHLEKWRRILKYSESFLLLSEFVKSILSNHIHSLGWDNKGTDGDKLLRPEILLASVLWEETAAINQSKQLLRKYINNSAMSNANLREVAYTGGVLSGEIDLWQHCWDRYISLHGRPDGAIERMQLLRALGKTKDAWLQNRLLSHVVALPPSEVVQVLEAIAGTPTGGAMACRFLQAKWYDLQARFGPGSVNFARVISAITKYGATKFDYDELKSLVHRFGGGPGMSTLNMTLRSVAANVEWVAQSQSAIYSWLDSNGTVKK